ncbi:MULTISPECIES: PH domain-containing protein [Prauserella salsuginis group]|uniref:PH domain-containing protein n=1 Tax=Prauserella salsuginis TaxID=387889 RepID=A0ABW6G3C3_9PSEU|nr:MULTISPECIES: PH domain-containing protein [Prauserella salsuginis group]
MRLRPPAHRVHRKAVAWWRTRILLVAAAAVAVLVVPAALLPDAARFWVLVPAAVLAVAGVAAAVGMPMWWYRVHRWEVTGDAVYTRTGALWQEWRVAPMSRIQTVDSERGPLEQVFGLATVTVTTASAKGALTIPGLDRDLAADLVHELTETTQATPGDAT